MKKKYKRLTAVILSLAMLALFCGSSVAFADSTVDQKQKELDELNKHYAEIQQERTKSDKNLTSLLKEITSLNDKINTYEQNINILNAEISLTKAKISEKLEELEQKENEINIQNDELNARLRAMYKNGNSGLLSVILQSTSITSLLTNIEMARRVYASDNDLLEGLHTEYDIIYQTKIELTNLKDELLSKQDTLKAQKAELAKQQAEVQSKYAAAKSSNAELKAEESAIQKKADALVREIRALQGDGAYAGGGMCWPSAASTRITSEFGRRYIFGSYSNHTGVDIGANSGTDILAANSGTVIRVAYDANGYGNYVMIDHGGGVVTLYGHQSKVLVTKGQVVKRGEVIGKVGSTGLSTGPHIHFEIRINGSYQDPLDTTKTYYVIPGVYYYD